MRKQTVRRPSQHASCQACLLGCWAAVDRHHCAGSLLPHAVNTENIAVLLAFCTSFFTQHVERSKTNRTEPDERQKGSSSSSWNPHWSGSSSAADLSSYASSLSTKHGCSLYNKWGLSIVSQSGIMPPSVGETVEFTHLLTQNSEFHVCNAHGHDWLLPQRFLCTAGKCRILVAYFTPCMFFFP